MVNRWLFLIALLGLPNYAQADQATGHDAQRGWIVGAKGGLHVNGIAHHESQFVEFSGLVQLAGGLSLRTDVFDFAPLDYLQFELFYSERGVARIVNGMPDGEFETTYLDLEGLVRLSRWRIWRFEPYLLIGGRVSFLILHANVDENGMPVGGGRDTVSGFDAGVLAGLGVERSLPWMEGEVLLEARADLSLIPIEATGQDERAFYGFGFFIGYQRSFGGGPRDRDQDGIADDRDGCVDAAEDRDGVQDSDGCPEDDADADGVLDDADDCDLEPGPADNAGCPMVDGDGDGDGVADPKDRCPDQPGDKDHEGCPDTDGDGVHDGADRCADQPETRYGFEDRDGCPGDALPDELADLVALPGARGGPSISVSVDGAGNLQPARTDVARLDRLASILVKTPAMKIRVLGDPCSSTGGPAQRRRRGKARADQVARYLAERGANNSIVTDGMAKSQCNQPRGVPPQVRIELMPQ